MGAVREDGAGAGFVKGGVLPGYTARPDLTEPGDDLMRLRLAPSSHTQLKMLAETKRSAHRLGCGIRVTQNRITGGWGCGLDFNIPPGQIVTEIREEF